MLTQRIGIFGSAFNPPHRGHEDVIRQAADVMDLIIVVPNYRHAFGKQMAIFEHRLAMTKAMALGLPQKERVLVSDIEQKIFESRSTEKPVYTFDLLCALEVEHPEAQLNFIVGPDNANPSTWDTFYRSQDILDRWSIWAAKENINIRSTHIRKKLTEGGFPTKDECAPAVIDLLPSIYPEIKSPS